LEQTVSLPVAEHSRAMRDGGPCVKQGTGKPVGGAAGVEPGARQGFVASTQNPPSTCASRASAKPAAVSISVRPSFGCPE
jgi:hypothetical protein